MEPQSPQPETKVIQSKWLRLAGKIDISPENYNWLIYLAEHLVQGEKNREDADGGEKIGLFWSQEEAKLVANFLKSFPETKIETETQEATQAPKEEEEETKESYEWREKKRGEIIQRVAFALLEKAGFPDSAYPQVGLRIKEERLNYSQDESFDNIAHGLLPREEGGPEMISKIFAPRYQEGRDISDERSRRGLAHEIMHVIRAQVNRYIWRNYEQKAERAQLEKASVGGFKVGSNKLGSEDLGELMGIFVENSRGGYNPTIKDVTPILTKKLKERLEKFKEEVEKNPQEEIRRARYLASNIAVLHHLGQLAGLGFGEIPISRILAIGACGYITLEKLPDLITTGVVNHDNVSKMEYVILEIRRWLNQESESGFKIKW